MTELKLVDTDVLVEEVMGRFNDCSFVALRDRDQESEEVEFWFRGSRYVNLGLIEFLRMKIAESFDE